MGNPYAYVGNRPLTLTDPSGECPICITALIGAAAGAAIGAGVYGLSLARNGESFSVSDLIKAAGVGAVGGALVGSGAGFVGYLSGGAAIAGGLLLGGAGEGLLTSGLVDSLDDGRMNAGAGTYGRDAAFGALVGLATAGLDRAAAPILKGPSKWLSSHVKSLADDVRGSVPLLPGGIKGSMPASQGATAAGARIGTIGQQTIRADARAIGHGHAFEKHVVQGREFEALAISTREQFTDHIAHVITTAKGANVKSLDRGRTAYWDDATRTVVITDPARADLGTAFVPNSARWPGRTYFETGLM